MYLMQDYMTENNFDEVMEALLKGGGLSLKTAGFITLFSFAFVTLPKTFGAAFKKELPKFFDNLRTNIGLFAVFMLTLLFLGRFPYYKAFGVTYDWQIFMGLNDDLGSVINMMLTEYGFLWRIPLALIFLYGLYKIFARFLLFDFLDLKLLYKVKTDNLKKDVAGFLIALMLTVTFGIFARFGGAMSYAKGINWENAQTLTDTFLNECMLDDGQALYRAYSMEVRMQADEIIGVYPASINEFAGGKNIETSRDLKQYLEIEAKGARIDKPEHIFIIVGETFASWPLFEEYESLNAGNFIKKLSKESNAYLYETIMPNGEYTAMALSGFMTGLMDCNLRINYQSRSYEGPYPTALAPQMEKLGYNTFFWYGGTLEWDHIGRLSKAQGFNEAYGYPEFHGTRQNTWGTTDEQLFDAVYKSLENSPPSLNLIMTVSNHPPYNMDLPTSKIEESLKNLPDIVNPKDLAVELAYYSYMDEKIYNFIKKTSADFPKSLFIVTGDHSVRMMPVAKPTDKEYVTVPLLFYGYGITKDLFNKDALPMHTSVMPTLAELIAPKGFKYFCLTPSVFEANDFALMNKYYMDKDEVKKLYKVTSSGKAAYESFRLKTLSWWLMFK